MKLSVAISPCPNDVFIFAGLITGAVRPPGLEFSFHFQELETLNSGARDGRWDVAKISYANAAGLEAYSLLRCGGALGRGCGPLLLSNRGARGASVFHSEAEILVPGERTTANFLLDFFHRNTHATAAPPLRKVYLPFDALYRRLLASEPCQGVVIHEMRFMYARDGLYLIRDLGEYWESATGHPIPLGAVALKRDQEIAAPGLAARVEDAIRSSLDWAYAHSEAALRLCREYSQSMDEAVLRSHIDLYVNDFSRNLGSEGESAVAFFMKLQRSFIS